jgi:uncharacterized protein
VSEGDDAVTTLVEPPIGAGAEPFWDATRDRRLVLPWCSGCDRAHWYPRVVCPHCLGDAIDWRPATGVGVVHAVSVQHKPGPGRDPAAGPYAVALVELPEGVRMMANIVGGEPDRAHVGMPVELTWHPLSDGRHLPQFRPSGHDA